MKLIVIIAFLFATSAFGQGNFQGIGPMRDGSYLVPKYKRETLSNVCTGFTGTCLVNIARIGDTVSVDVLMDGTMSSTTVPTISVPVEYRPTRAQWCVVTMVENGTIRTAFFRIQTTGLHVIYSGSSLGTGTFSNMTSGWTIKTGTTGESVTCVYNI